jgi:hypothetical protein
MPIESSNRAPHRLASYGRRTVAYAHAPPPKGKNPKTGVE